MGGKLICLPVKPPTYDHIFDVFNSPIWDEWYDSIFANYEKMEKSTTIGAPFERSLLLPGKKILCPRISFRFNTTYINNRYDLYPITCSYGSSILERVDFAFSYAPVAIIKSLLIVISIAYLEGLIILS